MMISRGKKKGGDKIREERSGRGGGRKRGETNVDGLEGGREGGRRMIAIGGK